MATIYYKIVEVEQYWESASAQLNTLGASGWELGHIYNNQAILISGSSGINVTGSVTLPSGVVSSSAQAAGWTVLSASYATTANSSSYSDTASYVNPLNQNVSATGTITAGGNLISSNSSGDEGGEILLAKAQTNTTLTGSGITIDSYQNKLRIFEQGGTARGGYFDLTTLTANAGTDLTRPISSSYALTASYAQTVQTVPTASVVGVLSYGQWYSTQTQSGSANTASAITYDSQAFANGFTLVSGSRITALQSGVYNFQFSAQLHNTTNDNILYDVWFKFNGADEDWSNSIFQVDKQPGAFGAVIGSLNYMKQMTSGSYIELWWSADHPNAQIFATGSTGNPTRPAVPSIITTVTQVG